MTPPRAPDDARRGDASAGLSAAFGVAAAASLRGGSPRDEHVDGTTAGPGEPPAAPPRPPEPDRHGRAADPDDAPAAPRPGHSAPAAAHDHPPRRPDRPVQVRDSKLMDGLLLAAVKASPQGSDVVGVVRECSGGAFELAPGMAYRALHRLVKERLLDAERVSGKRRYWLTDVGERVLAARKREWETLSHGMTRMTAFLDTGGAPDLER